MGLSIDDALEETGSEALGFQPTEYELLIHQVFHQSNAGKELVDLWKQELISRPVVRSGETTDILSIGDVNGRANQKREFIAICDKINNGGGK